MNTQQDDVFDTDREIRLYRRYICGIYGSLLVATIIGIGSLYFNWYSGLFILPVITMGYCVARAIFTPHRFRVFSAKRRS